ncbi:MAG: hypothetical protein R3300_00865 [Candidatus Promineifilaceae bacterium]|nr:hypothetical protein [Candidatus Promineifilaceae bacterium]
MEDVDLLGPTDVIEDRPFTNPDRIDSDLNTLRYMIDQLCLFVEEQGDKAQDRPIVRHLPSRESWIYRLIVVRPEQLLQPGALLFVGFLGRRKSEGDLEAAAEFDRTLVAELPEYPGLLSYSTMALVSGDFSNLVVFSDPSVKTAWSRSRAHAQAVDKLAPDYYASVCLYNGRLPHGVHDSSRATLQRVKYFDYQTKPMWRAIRVFDSQA